jgi:AcrR family transcriptional regulator
MGISERKEREKLQRRNDIIDAAEKVFFSKGIEQATMDDIAHAAEYSKGTLYLYFRNKEELLYAIKMRASRLLKERFSNIIDPKKNGFDNVKAIGRAFIQYSIDYPNYHTFMMFFESKDLERLNLEDPFIKKFMEEENPMVLFMEVVNQGRSDGSLRTDIPTHILAHNLWAMTTGVMQLLSNQKIMLEQEGYGGQEEQFIEGMFRVIENGIQKK